MTARVFICDSVDPRPVYERFRFDGIRFYRCTFPAGAHQTYLYPQEIPYAAMPTCHIQVQGHMVEPTGVWPDQHAGWISREEPFVIPAGTFTRLAQTDVVRWCCTGVADGEPTDFVTPMRLAPGATLNLQPGWQFLVAAGQVSVGDRAFTQPTRLRIQTGTRTLTADTEAFGFLWETAEVAARYPAAQANG
jgi:hypothetical protein